jgi:MFS transporter, FSR family, fosmidomycin resistance protein
LVAKGQRDRHAAVQRSHGGAAPALSVYSPQTPAPRYNMTASTSSLGHDARTIGLIGVAHGTSHFFHMLLPPLFPLFIRDFGFSYSELGLLVTTFFVVSGIGQALAGFLVDRVGALPVLFLALACFIAAALATALAPGYGGLMAAAALAGLGNSPFHPVDFTILNKRVSQSRLGHAFSVHGISGNLGWAAAPVFLTGLTAATGSWRIAAACAGLWAAGVLALLWSNRASIDDRVGLWAHERVAAAAGSTRSDEPPLAFLKLPSVWLCFSFFFWSTCGLSAIQGFASPALQQLYGLPLSITAFVVTGYMLFGAAGMVVGGFLASRAQHLERLIGACLLASALLLCIVASGLVPPLLAALLAALAGAGTGLAGPSRDMLIKRAAPPGATGRVYGTVYSGLDLGFAIAAPMFGALLDAGAAAGVFYGAAATLVMGVASAALVGLRLPDAARHPKATA